MEQEHKAVKDYQINIDYDIDQLNNTADNFGLQTIDDFRNESSARTTLENELKISDTEALNYLMGFPLSFNLKPVVETLFKYIDTDSINQDQEMKNITNLKLDFYKKKKLINQNFESTMHIDIQEFLAWAESKGFIKKKYTSTTVT